MPQWAITMVLGPIVGVMAVVMMRKTAFRNTHPFEYKMDWVIVGLISLLFFFAAMSNSSG
jgi:hypothetical protein